MKTIAHAPVRQMWCALLASAAIVAPASALAQATEVAPGQSEEVPTAESMGDIVVTAQKREERLQDVPLAITAVGADQLANRQINDSQNLVQAIPSLSFQQGSNATNTSFRIRGVGTALFGQGVEASVGLVVDGVVAARQAQSFTDFADIERVEVLRGTQGTLFGKNATAGVINVVTARPSKDFEANGDVTIAERDEYRVRGSVSGPITDTLRARITGYYNDVGGHYRNLLTDEWQNGSTGFGVRGKLEWEPTDNLVLLASADYRETDANCCQTAPVQLVNPVLQQLLAPVRAGASRRELSDQPEFNYSRTDQQTYSLQADLDLGAASITSITAFQKFNLASNLDVDRIGSASPVYVGGSTGAAFSQWNLNLGTVDLEQFTQELRVASSGSNRLNYVAGVFFADLSLDRGFARRRAICAAGQPSQIGQPCTPTSYQSLVSTARFKNTNYSAFGQVDWEVFDRLKLIGGLRVQHEEISVDGRRTGPVVAGDALFGGTIGGGSDEASDTAVTGRAGVQYEFSRRAQAYASYTRGYKGLGFDTEITAPFGNQTAVQPEHVNAYEIGFKGSTSDGKLTVALAGFWSDYTDLQIQANRSDPATGTVIFAQTNAGSSTTKGVELEATLQPSRAFSVATAVTYARSRADIDGLGCPLQLQGAAPTLTGNFPINSCYRRQSVNAAGQTVVSGVLQDVRNGRLPASPDLRINVSPRYDNVFDDLGLRLFAQVDVSFQSDQLFGIEQDPLLRQQAYATLDLSIGIGDPDKRYTLTAFVKNVTNQNYVTTLQHTTLLGTTTNAFDIFGFSPKAASRYFGATLAGRF